MSQTKAYGRFNFRVEFNGVTVGFSELTGLESAATSAGYRECSEPVHVQNVSRLRKFGNVTLKRGVIVEGPA